MRRGQSNRCLSNSCPWGCQRQAQSPKRRGRREDTPALCKAQEAFVTARCTDEIELTLEGSLQKYLQGPAERWSPKPELRGILCGGDGEGLPGSGAHACLLKGDARQRSRQLERDGSCPAAVVCPRARSGVELGCGRTSPSRVPPKLRVVIAPLQILILISPLK